MENNVCKKIHYYKFRIIFILGRGQSTLPRPLPQGVVFGAITATNRYSCCGRKIVLREYNCPSAWTENNIYVVLGTPLVKPENRPGLNI